MAVTARPSLEVADIVRAHGDDYARAHGAHHAEQKVLSHITACRTAALGGHLDACDSCGHQRISYNSCRDRHCPKCQATARAAWITERLDRLLPTPAFHVVFTIPAELNAIALANRKVVFDILFSAASKTLLQIARDPTHLGAQIGATAVLHTWGQNLQFHPHLHCVVTAGGLSPDAPTWIRAAARFLLPVKVLSAVFRGKFIDALDRARRAGDLRLRGALAQLCDPAAWGALKDRLFSKPWVVYAKAPFGGVEAVFRYLGNYTHRIAISNHRLIDLTDGKVRFFWRDYAHGNARKQMTLDAVEFLRRFLLHVLPAGYVRIRHYGLYASRNVSGPLQAARCLLAAGGSSDAATPSAETSSKPTPWWERFLEQTGVDVMACPACRAGRLVRLRPLSAIQAAQLAARITPAGIDSS